MNIKGNGNQLFNDNYNNFKITKKDLDVVIDNQITKKLNEVLIYISSLILAVVFGGIISSLWQINGVVRELKGKYSSSENMLEILNNRLESVEQENKHLQNKLQEVTFNRLYEVKNIEESSKRTKYGN